MRTALPYDLMSISMDRTEISELSDFLIRNYAPVHGATGVRSSLRVSARK